VQDISATKAINVVKIDDTIVAKLQSTYPFYTKTTIPAGTYKGVDSDTQTVAVVATYIVSDQLSEDLVYKMTKAMYSNLDRIKAAHAQGANVQKATALEGMGIKVHAGADKFFKEK